MNTRDPIAIAGALRRIAELVGPKDRYRARAFRRGADTLEAYRGDLDRLIEAGELERLPGIGAAIAREITALHETGASAWLTQLEEEARATGEVPKARPRKPRPKLGPPTEMVLGKALDLGDALVAFLLGSKDVASAELVGDAGRGRETVGAIEVLATGRVCEAVHARFRRWHQVAAVIEHRADRTRATLYDGTVVILHVRRDVERDHAAELLRGPPEPDGLVTEGDIRGALHCHTVYSDGRRTIAQTVRSAEKRGLSYVTITDHSPTAHYAGGVEVDRLKRQWDEIAAVQETTAVRILRGTESDILKDGELDYPDAILEQLDVIIASIHNRYRLDREAMTARITRALRHPLFKIWGHPLGRLLLRRPSVDVDFDALLEVAAQERVAFELNGDPYRMDLEPDLARRAADLGIPFVVSVDAHAERDFDHLRTGIILARRAGLTPGQVLNTLSPDSFATRVRPVAD